MCASPLRGAAAPVGAAEYQLRLSAFCFRFFRSFFSSVIRAEAALANASTGICLLQLRMERRVGVRRTPFCERLCRRRRFK
jgi:hypothetical protein